MAASAGGALTVAALAGAAWFGARAAVAVPARVLREQAVVSLRVQASLYAFDLRQAWAAVGSVGGGGRGVRMRGGLPAPGRAGAVVAWRDATGLVRVPARLLSAVVWTGVTLLVAAAVPPSSPVMALAAVTAYVAAAQLAEPARVEAGDLRRSAALPWSAARLALAHAVVPVAGAALLLAAGGGAVVLLGGATGPLVPLLLSVPALVGAAVVSAYRGVVPPHLMVGASTPMGDSGPFAALLWQVRGPLVGLLAVVAVAAPLRGATGGVASAVGTLLVGAGMLWWAAATARRTARGR
ncbi:hypothetical protein [Streptomyces lonarensis]|uniref:hypothetical protein n=1 Tax=Streptomyces lonarensis TaxID=700599 RepID=UPI0030C68683